MQSTTIICDNSRAGGALCGAAALVHLVHYIYSMDAAPASAGEVHRLREAHYDIDCPRCGRRTQIVHFD